MPPPGLTSLLSCLLLGQSPPESLASRVRVDGSADVYAAYNANRPADGANFVPGTGTSAKRDAAFALNLASLGLTVDPAPVGLRVRVGLGNATEVVHAGEPSGDSLGPDVWRHLLQASLSWVHGPLTLEAGVYPSHIGLEVLPSQDNWTYTRSWMGEFSPYYQTGLKGTWTFSPAWSAQLHVLNGWQNIGENNRGKALGTQVAYAGERLGASLNTFVGEEGASGQGGVRWLGDLVATLAVTEAVSLAASVDVGAQRRPGTSAAHWAAAALLGRVRLSGPVAIAARTELFEDRGGLITGAVQRLVEGTLTLEVRPDPHLVLKLEARHDRSSASVFTGPLPSGGGEPSPRPTQTLVVAGATAFF